MATNEKKKLNAKQEMFCREYIIDLNATQAAIRAGYSERSAKNQGMRLMTNDDILARVKELKDNRADELELDAYWVLSRLKEVSDRSMQAVPVKEFNHASGEMEETGEYEFDSHGANRSTELIGKHIGMFDPRLKANIVRDELANAKIKAETEFTQERTKLLKGVTKDTSLLEVLQKAVESNGKAD